MPSTRNLNLTGVIRVSRVGGRGGDTYISPDVQQQRIEAWATFRGHTIIAWQRDEDESGGKMSRPGLDRAIDAIRRREADGLVVAELTRFARTMDGLATIAEIEKLGGAVFDTEGLIDTTDPVRHGLTALLFGIASKYRVDAGAGWDRSQSGAVGRGIHVGACPYGYRRTGKPNRYGNPTGPLEVDPDTGPLVTAAFAMRAEGGVSWAEVAATLPGLSVPGVRKLIANRVYLGEARGGSEKDADGKPTGRPKYRSPGAHPALTDEVTFTRAASHLVEPSERNGHHAKVGNMRGLVRCAGCGHLMGLAARSTNPHSAYVCRYVKCTARAGATVRLLDAHVTAAIKAAWNDPAAPGYDAVLAIRGAGSAREAALAELEAARADLAEYHTLRGVTQDGIDAREAAVRSAQRALATAPAGVGPYAGQPPIGAPGSFVFDVRATYTALIDTVIVSKGREALPGRVRIVWRAATALAA